MNSESNENDSTDRSLELDGARLEALVEQALDYLRSHVDSLESQSAGDTTGRQALARAVDEPLPQTGVPAKEVFERYFHDLVPCSFNTAGPGYLAYIPGGGLPHAAVADLISGITNRYVGFWPASPALAQIETTVVRWFCEIVGYVTGAGGFLTSGGSLANFSAIFTARRRRLGDNFGDGVLYTSGQAHASVAKAAMLNGFAPRNVQTIPTDSRQRISVDQLTQQIEIDRGQGMRPFAIVAHAGTTNTGAVDNLAALADLAQQENLWLHVDAAYGGFFMLTDRGRQLMRGIERADSIALDPHKGLFLHYGVGCLLVRDAGELRRAHDASAFVDKESSQGNQPAYLTSGIDYFNFIDEPPFVDLQRTSPELSRPFRGLRIWLPLKMHGIGPFARNLDEKLDLAQYAYKALREMPNIEIIAEPELSLLAFRLNPPGYGDERQLVSLNEDLLKRINAKANVFLSSTTVDGRFALRICVLSFRTHRDRIDAALEDIRTSAAELLRSVGR